MYQLSKKISFIVFLSTCMGAHAGQEQVFIRGIKQQDPECIRNVPISSDSQVLKDNSLREITKEITNKPYLKNRIPMLEALTKKVGSVQEWYKRYHANKRLTDPDLLESAIGRNDEQLCDFILGAGIHPDMIKNPIKQTSLFVTICYERLEMQKKLIAYGANVNQQDKYLITPLHYAAIMGVKRTEIIDELVKAGANLNAVNRFGEAPLHKAIDFQASNQNESNLEMVESLLKNGSWVNKNSSKNKTPLVFAQDLARHLCDFQAERERTGDWHCATNPCKKLQATITLMQSYLESNDK